MSANSTYLQIFPQKKSLQKLIKLYYVQFSNEPDYYEKTTYFPNYTTTLNIYQHSKVEWDKWSRVHSPDLKNDFQYLLVGKFDRSRMITTRGRFNKLSIVFHPLGLNHFIEPPLSDIIQDHFLFFDAFGLPFDDLMTSVFNTSSLEKKRDLLDDFFEKQWLGFQEKRLSYCVEKILQTSGQIGVEQLAEELEVSRKTLLRLFKKHLGYTPSEYRSVVKFRAALQNYQSKSIKPNMSALAYESEYYDQSDLNHHFKEKTGQSPQQLFSQLRTIEKGLYWAIEDVPKVQDYEAEG